MYGVAIIGCGGMGKGHAGAWQARDDAKVLSVFDPDEARRTAMAEETGAAACDAYQAAIDTEGVNVVSVCTPVCYHPEVAIYAAEHKCHVLCEKPIALTLEEADKMAAAAEKAGVKLAVSYQYRTFPHFRRFRQLVQDGAFGGPVMARFVDVREVRPKLAMHSRSQNGGPVIDMAGHFFDLMRWLTGAEPVSVYARGHVFGKGKARLAPVADHAIDAAEITVEMEGGHVLSVNVNWGMPEGHPGLVSAHLIGPDLIVCQADGKIAARYGDHEVRYDSDGEELPRGVPGRVADLIEAVEQDRAPEVSAAEGRRALAVSLAALESIETGAVVPL